MRRGGVRSQEYRPERIVSVAGCVRAHVEAALVLSGVEAELHHLPFPGNGHQNKFVAGLRELLLQL
ncbi:hypothetical protein [Bosea sp. BIWAKO-01]|uniref:hypothetical protein n=1 Tax=Bosea sp. BIWAKO-01 TaxID=506668 RepID=UPI000853DAC9|nr:hypothetical protein [Bosea sp. BIWAKO-01]GAU82034.1 hypothetical protein BIWAKO_01937 [Bosea sp. BIWAKO-01]